MVKYMKENLFQTWPQDTVSLSMKNKRYTRATLLTICHMGRGNRNLIQVPIIRVILIMDPNTVKEFTCGLINPIIKVNLKIMSSMGTGNINGLMDENT